MQPYPIKLNWKAELDSGDMVVFPKFHQVPFSKILTFYRRDNFKIEAEYDGDVPVMNPLIGQFEIGDVKPLVDGGNQKVKVKVRINLHGVFVTSSANYTEKHEVSHFLVNNNNNNYHPPCGPSMIEQPGTPPRRTATQSLTDHTVHLFKKLL